MSPPPPKSSEPYTFKADEHLSFRLYPDNRPKNLEIAELQKGLLLVFDGIELIEEGIGFGVPIVKYRDKTLFPGSAEAFLHEDNGQEAVWSKHFTLDTVSKKRVWKGPFINDMFYRQIRRIFEKAYLRDEPKSLISKLVELRTAVGIRTDFVKVSPRGQINVTYRCSPLKIEVQVEVKDLQTYGCEQILVLNEQGGGFFQTYSDTNGTELKGNAIGAWQPVHAQSAALSYNEANLAFALRNSDRAALYRGREYAKGRFCWSGLTYALKPDTRQFSYTIEIKTGNN